MNVDVWEANILQAKTLLKKRQKTQMTIARLALEACEISHGGNRRGGYDGESVRTLKSFAEEVGIVYRTLHNWTVVYNRVYRHLPSDLINKLPYKSLERIAFRAKGMKPSDVVQRVKEYAHTERINDVLIKYSEFTKSMIGNFFEHKLHGAQQYLLEDICFLLVEGTKRLNSLNIKPVQRDIVTKNIKKTSDFYNFQLNEFDKKVYLVAKKPSHTKTIIMKTGLDKNRVMRSVRKLVLAGMIERKRTGYIQTKGMTK